MKTGPCKGPFFFALPEAQPGPLRRRFGKAGGNPFVLSSRN
jgi:hypothetical protein